LHKKQGRDEYESITLPVLLKTGGHSGIHLKCNPDVVKNRPVFYPSGKPFDTTSPLLARVLSTSVQLHPCPAAGGTSSVFAKFRFITQGNKWAAFWPEGLLKEIKGYL